MSVEGRPQFAHSRASCAKSRVTEARSPFAGGRVERHCGFCGSSLEVNVRWQSKPMTSVTPMEMKDRQTGSMGTADRDDGGQNRARGNTVNHFSGAEGRGIRR